MPSTEVNSYAPDASTASTIQAIKDSYATPVTEKLQAELDQLEIVVQHTNDKDNWTRHVSHAYLSEEKRRNHLTAGVLRGERMLSVAPALFQSKDQKHVIAVLHVGEALCGHPGIVHGGLLGTLLDEITAFTALPNLPGKTGFTANLNINYRHPTIANQFIVADSVLESQEGRKAYVKACLKTVDGTLLADATALFIAPKIPVAEIKEQLEKSRSSAPSPAPSSSSSVETKVEEPAAASN
ncbi:hypothetical protein BGW42_001945 [Actinomortierella wolfii]|nr:hypothetical protein BGW42_001945 [Actinomortierella wolfii]